MDDQVPLIRLTVNIANDNHAAIQRMRQREEISLTQAVHRLLCYGSAVYRTSIAGQDVLVRDGTRTQRLILLATTPDPQPTRLDRWRWRLRRWWS